MTWVGDILTMQLSPSEVLLTAEVGFKPGISGAALLDATNSLQRRVRESHPTIARIFLQPVSHDGNDNLNPSSGCTAANRVTKTSVR